MVPIKGFPQLKLVACLMLSTFLSHFCYFWGFHFSGGLYMYFCYIYIYIYILKYILLFFYFLNSYTYACICISSIIMYIAIKVSYIGQYWWRSAIFHTLPTALGREATTRDALVAATSGFLQRGSEVDLGVGWGWVCVCVCFDFP